MFEYNDDNKKYAKEKIDGFRADFGGTEIY
jgi:hypothetical protein